MINYINQQGWEPGADGWPEVRQHRVQVDQALAKVSRHLACSGEVDLCHVLGILGEAFGAHCIYLVALPGTTMAMPSATNQEEHIFVWHSLGVEAEGEGLSRELLNAKPSLRLLAGRHEYQAWKETVSGGMIFIESDEGRLLGYLGVECASQQCQLLSNDQHVMSILSDLFAGYFMRCRTQRSLKEAEERWCKLVDSYLEPVIITIDGVIVYINEAGLHVLGANESGDVLGCTVNDFVSAELYGMLERQYEALRGEGQSKRIEHRLIRLDGSERIVESVATPISFEGHPAVQMIMRDLTEQKEYEKHYSTLVGTISEAVWRIDLHEQLAIDTSHDVQAERMLTEGFLVDCNPAMARLLGRDDPRRIEGMPLGMILPRRLQHLAQEFIHSGYQLRNREVSVPVDAHHHRYFVLNAVGVVEQGKLKRILGSCAEETERVEVEQRLVSVMEEQQERVGRDLHDGVGQLLTGIRLLSNDLAARYFDERDEGFKVAQKVANFAEEASQHIHNIYRGLAPPQLYQESFAAALKEMALNLNGASGVHCTFIQKGQTDVLAGADKLQLYRIAQEATNNALKHAKATGLWITLKNLDGVVSLEVRDNGIGFSQKGRNGLGLYSMEHRAHSINARLSVESTPGSGTTITCTLQQAP